MRQAITTKYLGPTHTLGARIKAACAEGTVTVGYDHGLNATDNHRAAADALGIKIGRPTVGHGGWLTGTTHSAVFVQPD